MSDAEPVGADIARLRTLAQAATGGEWVRCGSYGVLVAFMASTPDAGRYVATCLRPADARFIAAANPAAVEWLCNQLDEWRDMAHQAIGERSTADAEVTALTVLLDETRRLGQALAAAIEREAFHPFNREPPVTDALDAWKAHTAGEEPQITVLSITGVPDDDEPTA